MPRPVRDARVARAAVVAAALVGAAGVAWSFRHGWPTLATHLRDDAFYEFDWAYNLATGRGPVVGAGAPTSGVQYLWSLLLALLGGGDRDVVPRLAVVLGVACHVLGAASWVLFARGASARTRAGAAAWCAALLWLGNPLLLRECQNGQETALACLLLALLWHARAVRERVFAPLAVLAVLARTDLLLVVLPLSLARHGAWRGAPAVLLAGGAHLAMNLWSGGHWLQDSGLPMAWLFHSNFALLAPTAGDWVARQWFFTRPVLLGGPFETVAAGGLALAVAFVARPFVPARLRWLPLAGAVAAPLLGLANVLVPTLAAVFVALLPRRPRGSRSWWPSHRLRRGARELAALLLGLVAVLALHWALRWYPRDYYAAPLAVLAAAAVVHARRLPWLLLATALLSVVQLGVVRPEPLGGQRTMELCGRWLHAFVPPGETVGSFNSGIVTWFAAQAAPPLGVQNLDGVVDRRALRALQDARLGDWLDGQGIRFVADNAVEFAREPERPHACGVWFGPEFAPERDLVELARFVVAGGDPAHAAADAFRLYWRTGRGEAPPPPLLPPAGSSLRALGTLGDGSRAVAWSARAGETLCVEEPGGARTPLLRADAAIPFVLALPPDRFGRGHLFVDGGSGSELELR